jgi:polysaccharide export outer membrane protein
MGYGVHMAAWFRLSGFKRFSTAIIGASCLLLPACAGSLGQNVAQNPASFRAPDPAPLPQLSTDRKLLVGDVINVRVYKADAFSGDQTVDSAGRINIPLIGYVPAAGHTTTEIETALAQALGAKYLVSPSVSVTLKTAVQNMITIDGSVQQPGVYPLDADATLVRAIAMARGTADGANPRRVVVFRRIDGQRMAASFDLTSIRRGKSPDPPVYANDIVVVDGSALAKTLKTSLETLPFVTLFRPF